jgi:hypothetical protein
MTIIWSHPTWSLFHITTANLIEESFDEKFKNECIDLFTKICNAIPCMFCRVHAAEYMKTINRDEIKTARDLELFFWKFHNEVNERSKKEVFTEEKLVTYKQKNINRIKNEFKDVLYMYYRNEELLNEFNTFMQQNNDKFIHFKEIKEERKDDKVKVRKDDKVKVRKDDKVKVRKDAKVKVRKDDKDRKERKDDKDRKERKDAKDRKERKDAKDRKERKDAKDKKERKDAKDKKERKDAKDKKERKDAKDRKERKDAKDKKERKDAKDRKERKDAKDRKERKEKK